MSTRALTRLSELRSWSRHLGGAAVGRLAAAHAAGFVAGKGLAMSGEPGLDEMLRVAGEFHDDAVTLLAEAGLDLQALDDPVDLAGLHQEFRAVSEDLTRRYADARGSLAFGLPTRVQDETAFLLYAAVRSLRPAVVVETGVANGHSSFFLLAALDANVHGRLHSFDIDDACGSLVEQRDRWELTICRSSDPAAEFVAALRRLGPVDVFFHDADHRYLSQLLEYRTVWPQLVPGGLLLSDDVDDSRAFFDFSRAVNRRPALLFDRTKVTGLIRR
jgi:predicted O-methyltransferase YrrM